MSLISREKVIEKFQNYQRDCENAGDAHSASVFADAVAELEDMPESQHWIPTSEGLPGADGMYLVYIPSEWPVQAVHFAVVCGKPQFTTMNNGGVLNKFYWMPLPQLPKAAQ